VTSLRGRPASWTPARKARLAMILAVLPVPVLLPLQGAFAVLRLSHACDWSWWLVTSPGLAVAAVWAVAGTAGAWWAFAARGRAWRAHG